jgi:hypothetical protein
MSTLGTPSAQTKYGPGPTATRIVSGSSDYIHPDVASATGVASVVLRQAHHQHEPQAVARIGVTRHRLHQGLPEPSGSAGLAPCRNPAVWRAFVPWSAGHRKCGIVLTTNGFVDMDSRPSQLKTCFEMLVRAIRRDVPLFWASAYRRRPSRKRWVDATDTSLPSARVLPGSTTPSVVLKTSLITGSSRTESLTGL